jgi:hypothetical protein
MPRRLSSDARGGAFASKRAAFDAAAKLTRKLRFLGVSLDVRTGSEAGEAERKAS